MRLGVDHDHNGEDEDDRDDHLSPQLMGDKWGTSGRHMRGNWWTGGGQMHVGH